ncbi:Glyoxylase or a related metal-dependent hydrolase [Commensalibacter communis]|uniref:Hydroxyacylglutathione hydrolase n=1 Tax=Commensalibacter communis TaxID=2972786 RepID=A0A9W4TKH7_9PROT|nr:hydroxyacylglutathione hydrolase [Commensalibacter communis]CAI3924641.1 Glyoxylase or a related metal-dependent hydrolase [Commensalibacter communis]CAI3926136.1 Glyoxylase or a related metal-dependent hydrolase [Commensalibacter communis]CAI3926187.1 Glyoxylase or a related metal-dependent hydrolase [Commensalibacter communis]CAI3928508.1 Glyoxylase or a related metal-dependent hydrolase [Commensalibacter communis]CAI3928553.1 Glyoxylase or a related metal-dependent hydrolase [Commensalib
MSIIIEPISFYESNYAWIMIDEKSKNAIVVDPGDAKPVLKYLEEKQLSLQAILITHFHDDHIGGIAELKSKYSCKIYAPLKEINKIPNIDQTVKDGDIISLEAMGQAEIIETPGHTLGSICYYLPNLKVIFTGDTMFSMGCGRLFEGTPQQMYNSFGKLKNLPEDTLVYCAHEYTADNGRFAISVIPESIALKNRVEQVKKLRSQYLPTLPISLLDEKRTNPFLLAKNVDEFTAFRKAKDHFA